MPAEVDVDVVTKAADGSDTVRGAGGVPAARRRTGRRLRDVRRRRGAGAGPARALLRRPRRRAPRAAGPDPGGRGHGDLAQGRVEQHARLEPAGGDPRGRACRRGDGDMLSDVLPVNAIATGAGEESYGVNAQQAAALMRGPLRAVAGEGHRAAGRSGCSSRTAWARRVWLTRPGPSWSRQDSGSSTGTTHPSSGRRQSAVLIPDSTPASVERGAAVAAALGLPASSVGVSGQGQTVAEVIVVLGRDFKP